MVTALLDFSKVESGKVEVHREAIEIVGLTQTVLADFQPLMQHKGRLALSQPPMPLPNAPSRTEERSPWELTSSAVFCL
jgi:signal transduction histidine kinase